MKKILALPAELYQNRKLVLSLAKNDFKTKYAGSYLGIVWAFIQPIVTILVYWFVFSVGTQRPERYRITLLYSIWYPVSCRGFSSRMH